MKTTVLLIFLSLFVQDCSATERPDLLIYEGDTLEITQFPLDRLLQSDFAISNDLSLELLRLSSLCTSHENPMGYQAIWKIENKQLILSELRQYCDNRQIDLKKIVPKFHNDSGAVIASWFSGELISHKGKILASEYGHDGYTSITYEKLYYLKIRNGKVKKNKLYLEGK